MTKLCALNRVSELESENARLRSLLDADPEIDGPAEELAQHEFEEFSKRYLGRKKDSERIDWLEANNSFICSQAHLHKFGCIEWRWNGQLMRFEKDDGVAGVTWKSISWRDAIDAAMAAKL